MEIGASALTLSDAHLAIAREYGFNSWPRLKKHIESDERAKLDRSYVDRIEDEEFRSAVIFADDGDLDGLRAHLARHPDLVHKRIVLEGGNYFREPALLEFVAENPIRHESMPPNVVEIARAILDAGAKSDSRALGETLALVCSGRVSRECGLQCRSSTCSATTAPTRTSR